MAIVDEAQDTSRLQWEFLNEIFPQADRDRYSPVGDPKQAIYGFPRGDVNAYLRILPAGRGRRRRGPAPGRSPRNHRSDGDLLAGLNSSMQAAEFGRGILYQHVDAQRARRRRIVGLRPSSFSTSARRRCRRLPSQGPRTGDGWAVRSDESACGQARRDLRFGAGQRRRQGDRKTARRASHSRGEQRHCQRDARPDGR